MGRARSVGLTAVVVAASAAGEAPAAPPWSEPRDIGAAAPIVSRATLAFAPDGSALLSRRISPDAVRRESDRDRVAVVDPGGTLVEHRLPDLLAAPPRLLPGGRVALLRERVLSFNERTLVRRVRLSLSVGSLRRPVPRGRPRRVATYQPFTDQEAVGPAMAVGPRGEVAIAWMTYRPDGLGVGRFRVRLAIRRPDGRFERTRTVASGSTISERESHNVAVAFGARREVLVAYAVDPPQGRRRIVVRTLRGDRRLGRPQTLGPEAGVVDLQMRATRSGRAIVAWGTQDGGEEANQPWVVRAAIRGAGGRRFGPALVIDPGEAISRVPGRVALAMAPDGTAVLAWSNARGRFPDDTYPARAAVVEAGAPFGPVVELAPDRGVADAAARPDGALLVALTDVRDFRAEGPRETYATLRPGPGQPFGAPELVDTSSAAGGFSRGLAAAFDPRTGRPALAWTASTSSPIPDQGSDVLRMATRTG